MKDLDQLLVFVEAVIDMHGSMENLADTRTAWNGRAHPGKALQQFDVVISALPKRSVAEGNVAQE
jgi:hypothetical protein